GTYAITYWRPDGRDAQKQITYLNYNGTQPLNTDYNGIAVEVAELEKYSTEEDRPSVWGEKSKRCITKEGLNGEQHFWDSFPKSASIWGVLYQGENSETGTIAGGLASVRISDNSLSFVEPDTRKCSA